MSKTSAAPAQQQMSPVSISMSAAGLVMNREEKMYFMDPLPNASFCDLLMLAFCGRSTSVYTPFELVKAGKAERKAESITTKNPCSCCCPYQLDHGGKKVATVEKPGCCANGCADCCCCLVCTGHYKHLIISGSEEGKLAPKFMILQRMVPCWPIAMCCATFFFPCGNCMTACFDCCALCEGKVAKEISQPVYRKINKYTDTTEKVGDVVMTNYAACSWKDTFQLEFVPAAGFVPTPEDLHSITLLLQMYEGLGLVDCSLGPGRPKFPKPTGVPCADFGLGGSVKRLTIYDVVQGQMKLLSAAGGSARQVVGGGQTSTSPAPGTVGMDEDVEC
jgi:hypothetical protein